ncbi:MAG TPA: glycoside hydrolase family 2 protein [Bacteroidia bacterium]|nr:glycoside hydrolase family 2 protein [Bacteroidia bacterium]
MKIPLLVFSLCIVSLFVRSQAITQSLNSGWQFTNAAKKNWKPATVPGTVHTDLLANKMIPDPYLEANADSVQWVETKTWEYKSTFDCSKELWKQKVKELDFEGLDTYADVFLNDSLIFTAEDMFLSYSRDVTHLLKKKHNTLRVVFHPISELIAKNRSIADVKNLPGGDRVFVRKAQYQFGWDWGPRLVTCGIWKNVKLIGYTHSFIRDAKFFTEWIAGDSAYIKYSIALGTAEAGKFSLGISTDSTTFSLLPFEIDPQASEPVIEGHFVIRNVKLWWCNGSGEPDMYRISVKLLAKKWSDEKTIPFGVRTIQLETLDENAFSTFRFVLNGKPVFAKGANWIPCDNFIPRVTHEKYFSLINEAKNDNMNMLRVWGGGIYEQDDFYNICDSLGIMVWQDLMFACGMYPGSLNFYNQVKSEATDNMWRLANHPCISVYCGNNEDDEGWQNWDWQNGMSASDSVMIARNYNDVFNDRNGILRNCVSDVYMSWFPYIATSPLTGWGHKEAYKRGDVHYWGVWWGDEPFSSYDTHVGRFVSEYGFQSYPDLSSLYAFTKAAADMSRENPGLFSHEKDDKGIAKMSDYIMKYYPLGLNGDLSSVTIRNDYSMLTQVVQRDAFTRAIEAHRRNEPYCMGTFYWQFDDCWPAISWSTTDYFGQKKLAQYAIKDLYAPQLLSVIDRNDSIIVYAVNDDDSALLVRIDASWQRLALWGGFIGTSSGKTLPPHSSTLAFAYRKKDVLKEHSDSAIYLRLWMIDTKHDTLATKDFFLINDKGLQLQKDPGLVMKVIPEKNADGSYSVRIYSKTFAKDVALCLDDVHATFSDNGIDIVPESSVIINVKSKYNAAELQTKLQLFSINSLK